MQTRATLALSMHMRYIQFWKILCCPLVLKVIYKVFVFFAQSSCCLPRSPSQEFPLQVANNHYSLMTLGYERKWVQLCVVYVQGRKGKRSFTKVQQNGWFGHGKQCQGAIWNFNCTTLRKKKKEVSFENEATLQVKVGGLFVCLSHFVGGLEYCCTMVYLPFLLQYNLLKLSVNKTEFWYYRPAVSE